MANLAAKLTEKNAALLACNSSREAVVQVRRGRRFWFWAWSVELMDNLIQVVCKHYSVNFIL